MAFLAQIKSAAKVFVEQLRPSDMVRPVSFHGEIKSLTSVGTNDPGLLNSAIDQMELGPVLMGTRLYDAVDFTFRVLKPESARKAIVLFTDGENMNVTRQSFAGVAEELRRQYLIGYYPKEPAQRGQERKIKVKVSRKRVDVRARTSYAYVR